MVESLHPSAALHADIALHTEAHVWRINLAMCESDLHSLTNILSVQEKGRADRFFFARDRQRYIAGHGCTRMILGAYLCQDPASLEFNEGLHGKPCLRGLPLSFNLSHSHDVALLGVTRAGDIGVDVEKILYFGETEDLVDNFFSHSEAAQFAKICSDEQPGAFLNLWTRKEALLKATGEGIAHSLNRVEVSFSENEPTRILEGGPIGEPRGWTLEALHGLPGYKAAVAVRLPSVAIKTLAFPGLEEFRSYVEASCT